MFDNLKAELARRGLDGKKLANLTGIHINTMYKKLNGEHEFKLNEMELIKAVLRTDAPYEYLFKR